jgi:hypothetical protein
MRPERRGQKTHGNQPVVAPPHFHQFGTDDGLMTTMPNVPRRGATTELQTTQAPPPANPLTITESRHES